MCPRAYLGDASPTVTIIWKPGFNGAVNVAGKRLCNRCAPKAENLNLNRCTSTDGACSKYHGMGTSTEQNPVAFIDRLKKTPTHPLFP